MQFKLSRREAGEKKKNVWGIRLTRVTEQQLDVLSEGIVFFPF